MSDWIMWPVVAVSLWATFLNNDKNKWCWPMWLATNAVTGIHLTLNADWPLVARQAAFFALSVRGMWKWWRATERQC